jgi:hypothetical protein
MCVPKPLRHKILFEVHEGILSSHPGVIHMYDKLREYVWWPSMLADVTSYVKKCKKCQQQRKRMKEAPILPVRIPKGPWQQIGIDITGPFPTTSRGNQYILVVMDHFTRWAEAFPIVDQTTETIANIVINNIICRYGLPLMMVSDRGSPFISKLATHIYALLGIKRITTTAYHPQGNGIVERFNGTLKVTLTMWINEQHSDWDLLLPFAIFAYNVSVHRVLQETPFYLSYGRDARLPIDYLVTNSNNDENESTSNVHEYAMSLVNKLKDVHTRVIDILTNINNDRIEELDGKVITDITIGDQVWLYKHNTDVGKSKKLTRRWIGPYIVVEQSSLVNYVIEKHGKREVVHINRLKKAYSNDTTIQSYEDDIQMAQQELECISQVQQDMIVRQLDVKQRISQLEALSKVHQPIPNITVNSPPNVDSKGLTDEVDIPEDKSVEQEDDGVYAVDMVELYDL